jgi:predicted metal-dependent peptidase
MTATAEKELGQAEILGPTDPAVDAEAVELLITARVGLLLKHSFFGNIATRLTLVNADEWCPTAAVDGRRMYYNSRFVVSKTVPQLQFLFAHEVLHVIYDHLGRRGDRDPQLSNCAQDYVVNDDLVQHNIGEMIKPCLWDTKYRGMSWEEVYDKLYDEVDKISLEQLVNQMIDEHLDGEGEGSGGGDGKGDQEGKQGKKPVLSDAEREQIKQEIKEAMLTAAQTAGAGNLPAGVKRLIDTMTDPKLNWRQLIAQEIEACFKNDYSFVRPNKRGAHIDAILPGMIPGQKIDVVVMNDCSGSMSDAMLRDIHGEVKGIMQSFEDFELHVGTFDTEVYNFKTFTPDNIHDIDDYQFQGGGGTQFDCIFDYLKANDIMPKKLIIFTDGYPYGSWGDPAYCDTIFVIHGNNKTEAPFGITCQYEEYKR